MLTHTTRRGNMLRNRIAVVIFGAALATGGGAVAVAHALTEGGGDDTSAPAPATPFTVEQDLPGVGHVSFVFDPSSGDISNVVVTPLPGVTVGAPVVTGGVVQITVTLADGSTQTLTITSESDDGAFKPEVDLEENESAPPEAEQPEAEQPESNDQNDDAGKLGRQQPAGGAGAEGHTDGPVPTSGHHESETPTSSSPGASGGHEGEGGGPAPTTGEDPGDHHSGGNHHGDGDGHEGDGAGD